MTGELYRLLDNKAAELDQALMEHLSDRRDFKGLELLAESKEHQRMMLDIEIDELTQEVTQ